MRHENPSVLNHGTMEKCELGSILSDYLQVCLGLGWSANWSPDHEPSCDSTYLLASVTWRKSHQENGMPKNKPRHQWSIKASHCHFPRRGGPEAGSNWASQSHRQKITPVTLRWAYLSSPGELSPSPWSPWGNKEYIWSLFPTRTGWAASLTAPWEAEALSMTLPQNLSQPPITRVFYRMRQVLPESTPVTMQTPRLHPKPTMWWSYFVVQAGFKHISSCFSLWNSKVTGAYYHGNCIYTKYLKLGALPLVHLLHTVVWELFPGPVSMAIPNVFFWETWQLWVLSLPGKESQAYQSHIFDSKLSQGSLLEKSLWEWSFWNQLTKRAARLHGEKLTSSLAPRLFLNFSWAEHEADASDRIQVLLGSRTLSTPRSSSPCWHFFLKEKNYRLPGMVISLSHTQSLPPPYRFVSYFPIHGCLTLRNS